MYWYNKSNAKNVEFAHGLRGLRCVHVCVRARVPACVCICTRALIYWVVSSNPLQTKYIIWPFETNSLVLLPGQLGIYGMHTTSTRYHIWYHNRWGFHIVSPTYMLYIELLSSVSMAHWLGVQAARCCYWSCVFKSHWSQKYDLSI